MAEQPMPVPNDRPSIQSLVRADLGVREQVGIQRYGTPLQAGNGRDALRDAYEEALDLATYLRQVIEERDFTRSLVTTLLEQRDVLVRALTDCVRKATDYGTQDGDFVAMYLLPTGPIHRAIPLLQRHGVTARPHTAGALPGEEVTRG